MIKKILITLLLLIPNLTFSHSKIYRIHPDSHFNRLPTSYFCLYTIRKSGTHLAFKLMNMIFPHVHTHPYYIKGHVERYCDHVKFLKPEKKIPVILLIRDIRDALVSNLFYVEGKTASKHHLELSFNEKLMKVINGEYGLNLQDDIHFFNEILNEQENILIIHFENLVGPEGGGSRKKQMNEIYKITRFLNLDFSKMEIEHFAKNLYGTQTQNIDNFANTYRKGQTGEWKKHFNFAHKNRVKELYGDFLTRWGYEKDNNW